MNHGTPHSTRECRSDATSVAGPQTKAAIKLPFSVQEKSISLAGKGNSCRHSSQTQISNFVKVEPTSSKKKKPRT